jgi:gliding motility-associated protein GldC
MSEEIKQRHQLKIDVGLNEENIPVEINWKNVGPDGSKEEHPAKAMLVSFFERQSRDTLKIDLWTKDMQVMEMDRFFYQTLRSMADTYFRATGNKELASAMQQFVQYFGEKTEVTPPTDGK